MLIQNCLSSTVADKCDACKYNYIYNISTNSCVEGPNSFCMESDALSTCTKCYPGYISLGTYCTKISKPSCLLYDFKGMCIKCKDPFDLVFTYLPKYPLKQAVSCKARSSSNPTISVPPNCEFVDWKGFCIKCLSNYYVGLGGRCVKQNLSEHCLRHLLTGECYECEYGYYWDPIAWACQNLFNYEGSGCLDTNFKWPYKANGGRDVACGTSRPSNCDFIDKEALKNNQL